MKGKPKEDLYSKRTSLTLLSLRNSLFIQLINKDTLQNQNNWTNIFNITSYFPSENIDFNRLYLNDHITDDAVYLLPRRRKRLPQFLYLMSWSIWNFGNQTGPPK